MAAGGTPLHAAARDGNNRTVATLLAFGAGKDALDADGNSPLFLAARHDHAVVTSTMLGSGAVYRAWGSSNHTAFEEAASRGYVQVLGAFISHVSFGPGIAELDSALALAVIEGHMGAVDVLAAAGGDVDQVDSDGDGGCHLAWTISMGDFAVMRTLIRHGALVNAEYDGAGTLLTYACTGQRNGFWEAIDILLRCGADETILDAGGRSCLQLLDDGNGFVGEHYDFPGDKERARLLLTRAPNDRAWRRRSWLVMLHSRALKDGVDAVSMYGGSRVSTVEYAGGGGECLGPVVGSLIGLTPEGVFRNVVSYL